MTFNYTDEAEDCVTFDSSSVEHLWYNANDKTLAVEWQESEEVYVYSGVTEDEYTNAVEGDSVGRAVAAIKQKYGPGRNAGDWDEFADNAFRVSRTENSTREFSLQPPVVNNYSGDATATTEYSLQTPEVSKSAKTGGLSLVDGDVVFTLYFTVDGGSDVKTHVLRNVENFDEAVETLQGFAESAGLDLKISEVRATFE